MATLNIKNLPDGLYRKIQARARREHRSVSQEVTRILEQAVVAPEALSLLDLKGLGIDLWRGRNAAAHVAAERTAWD